MQSQRIHLSPSRKLAAFCLGTVASVLAKLRRTQPNPIRPTPKHAVILEPYGMGDCITLEPLIRNLLLLNFHVTLCAQSAWSPLFIPQKNFSFIDAAFPWTHYHGAQKYKPSAYLNPKVQQCWTSLKSAAPGSIGIDPRGDIRSVLAFRLAGFTEIHTLESYLGTDLRIPATAATTIPYPDSLKRWQVNLLFLQSLRLHPLAPPSPPRFEHLESRRTASNRIGLVPLAPWKGKLWSPPKWRELSRQIVALGLIPVGLCGPSQLLPTREILGPQIPVEECDSIPVWTSKLQSLRCLITLDSGPMHLADALQIPLVALFGQGKLPLWAPSNPHSRLVSRQSDPDFVPCQPLDHNAHLGATFMDRIATHDVLHSFNDLLATTHT